MSLSEMVLFAALSGAIATGGTMWLVRRRFEPTLRRVIGLLEREMNQAERALEAAKNGAAQHANRSGRQAASAHRALDGMRALEHLTEDLDHHAGTLRRLANVLTDDTSSRHPRPTVVDHIAASARDLSITAEHARQTYQRLHQSVQHLLEESDGLSHDAQAHAHAMTGAYEHVRQQREDALHAVPAGRSSRDDRPVPRPMRPDGAPARPRVADSEKSPSEYVARRREDPPVDEHITRRRDDPPPDEHISRRRDDPPPRSRLLAPRDPPVERRGAASTRRRRDEVDDDEEDDWR